MCLSMLEVQAGYYMQVLRGDSVACTGEYNSQEVNDDIVQSQHILVYYIIYII
jgi:hypothetical protein